MRTRTRRAVGVGRRRLGMRACPAEEGERVWSLGVFFNKKNRIPSVDRMYICSTVIVYHERKEKKDL